MAVAAYEVPARRGMPGRFFVYDSIEEVFKQHFWDKEEYRIYCGAILIDRHDKMWSIIRDDFTYYSDFEKHGFQYYHKGDYCGW